MMALNTLKSCMKSIGLKLSTMLYLIWFVLIIMMLVFGRALLNWLEGGRNAPPKDK